MKIARHLFLVICLLIAGQMYSQNSDGEISEQVTKKKYEMYEDGKLVKKSVEIRTVIKQGIKFTHKGESNVNARMEGVSKNISKTVNIDNDIDDDYDEVIRFAYNSYADKDFLLGTNDDEIFTALENSTYLSSKNKNKLSEEKLNSLFALTDGEGNVLHLMLSKHNPIQ